MKDKDFRPHNLSRGRMELAAEALARPPEYTPAGGLLTGNGDFAHYISFVKVRKTIVFALKLQIYKLQSSLPRPSSNGSVRHFE